MLTQMTADSDIEQYDEIKSTEWHCKFVTYNNEQ